MRSPHRDDLNAKRQRGRGLYEDRLLNMLQFLPFLWLCLFGILTGLYFFGGWTAIVYGIVGLIVLPSLDIPGITTTVIAPLTWPCLASLVAGSGGTTTTTPFLGPRVPALKGGSWTRLG